MKSIGGTILILTMSASLAHGQDIITYSRFQSWTPEERAQLQRYYEPIGMQSRSTHWHDWDCCQSYRCFPARPGVVKWTPDGIAVTHPDGDVHLYSENDEMWKPKKGEGLSDPRDHICFERENDEWIILCGYRAGVQG